VGSVFGSFVRRYDNSICIWHDLRHQGACRLLADGVDIRVIQLMLAEW
jgi:site-specific recombinase XerD